MSIPRRLLIHSATLYKKIGVDEYGKITYQTTGTTINYVRLEPVKRTSFNSLGEGKEDTFKLFYDATNSTSASIERGDKIVFNSLSNYVREIETYYTTINAVHHYEIRLKGSE